MSRFFDHPEFDDEMPEDEYLEHPELDIEMPDENLEDQFERRIEIPEDKSDVLDEWYAEHIKDIDNPEIRAREIKAAEKISDRERELAEQYETGEIDDYNFWAETEFDIRKQKSRLSTRTAFESEGLSYDKIFDLADDYDLLITDNQKIMELKEDVKNLISIIGPEAAQEKADQMLNEERLSKEAHDIISRQVRIASEDTDS